MDAISSFITERAEKKSAAKRLVTSANQTLAPLSDAFLHQTSASEGVVVFGINEQHYPERAATLTTPTPDKLSPFTRRSVAGRLMELSATTLGDEYRRFRSQPDATPYLLSSRLNPSEHMVWTQPVIIDGRVKGLAQLALKPQNNNGNLGIDQRHIASIFHDNENDLHQVVDQLAELSPAELELAPPITPNAYTIRWDIQGSTQLATGNRQGEYLAYKQTLTDGINRLLEPFQTAIDDAGDGQNIVLYLPPTVPHDDQVGIQVWGRAHLPTLITQMQELNNAIVTNIYPDLKARIRLSVDVGHVTSDNGALDSDSFSRTAREMKRRPSAVVTYTERASFLDRK